MVVKFEISVEFCANSWPCCERIATIAGSRVEWGGGLYPGGMWTEEIGGAPDNSDNGGGGGGGGGGGRGGGGGGGTTERLVEEEKRSIDASN